MWLKGNLHTHTSRSDGDASPDLVAKIYRELGYDFVVLTDHNVRTGPEHLENPTDGILIIAGTELSASSLKGPVHLCALGVSSDPPPAEAFNADHPAESLQKMIDWAISDRALPMVCHPNFHYAISAEDILLLENCNLLELYNGHASCNYYAAGGMPGSEDVWQAVLAADGRFYGTATDDTHTYQRPYPTSTAPPARGWVVVEAQQRSPEAVLEALKAGRFYASTEIEIEHYSASSEKAEIRIAGSEMLRYSIELMGPRGTVLAEVHGTQAEFDLTGVPKPCRIRVRSTRGGFAWTQPVW